MKLLIYLKLEYYGQKPDTAFKQFREDLKALPHIKLIRELSPKSQAVVAFPAAKLDDVREELRALDIVAIIDTILPKDEE